MTNSSPVNLADLIANGTVTVPPIALDTNAKQQLAESGTPFTLTSLTQGTSPDFGPYVELEAQMDSKAVMFRLAAGPRYQAFYSSLAAALGTQPVSGVRLCAVDRGDGGADIMLCPVTTP